MLDRINKSPVSRYLPRNCNAAMRATVVESRADFNAQSLLSLSVGRDSVEPSNFAD
jgi:hypothetical protein